MRPYHLAAATAGCAIAAIAGTCLSLWLASILPYALPRSWPMLAAGMLTSGMGAGCCAMLAIDNARALAVELGAPLNRKG